MKIKEIKCKECGKTGTLYVENNELYCEEHCDYLKKDE